MKTQLTAALIGNYVQESLLKAVEGKVMGVTSKGVFLLFGKNSLFLTRDNHRSPFNIILSPESVLPPDLSIGELAYYSQGDLLIPSRQTVISLVNTPIWIPPFPCPIKNSRVNQTHNAQKILDGLLELDSQKGFLFLGNNPKMDTSKQSRVRQIVKAFSKAFQNNEMQACLEASSQLFGLGTGLTPSGDDWITGFMLYQCCQEIAAKNNLRPFIGSLGAELTYSAYRQTTWISANRVEAAIKGWSEELFLTTINYLFDTSSSDPQNVINDLFNFGHSSGVDTFMGIAYACKDW